MRVRVVIHDHLKHCDHEREWSVAGYLFHEIEGSIHASFVRAFGTSADRVEVRSLDDDGNGEFYAKGMVVTTSPVIEPAEDVSDYRARTSVRPSGPRRNQKRIAYGFETLPLKVWAARYHITYATLASRLKFGWSIEEALKTPLCKSGRNPYRAAARKAAA